MLSIFYFYLVNIYILSYIFRPKSGSMLLYSRKKVRYRRDGYCWKKRKDGKTTREDHMKLKVQGTEVILLNINQCVFMVISNCKGAGFAKVMK